MKRFCSSAPLCCVLLAAQAWADRPNVILIMTDDQGYGDFGATGNPLIETPHIDAMARRSASMNTFYVCPVCSPTRACLMTGRYNYRTRCIDTYAGRSMMEPDEVTIAELLASAGYATGIFGKWHLGDCYPLRPIDQGFAESLVHRGGGLAQSSEPLENDRRYTNPILFKNGEQVETEGYCTDVYFSAALEFITNSVAADKPFFAYIPTNTPHSPFHDVPDALYERYRSKDLESLQLDAADVNRRDMKQDELARIAAMITNVDDNVGRLQERLEQLQITPNTIVIFMVDNGPNSSRFVGPFRGSKTNIHEGGIRSPFWMQWSGVLKAQAASDLPAAHIDVLPTLLDACGVKQPPELHLDGRSFLPLLRGEDAAWPDRYLAIQSHRGDRPQRYHHFMIRDSRWKLLHASGFHRERFEGEPNFELYDLHADPGERKNLYQQQPEHANRLRKAYDQWFDNVSTTRADNYEPPRIVLGASEAPNTVLTPQDARRLGTGQSNLGVSRQWLVEIAEAGVYDANLIFKDVLPAGQVAIRIGDVTQRVEVEAGARTCRIEGLLLKPGKSALAAGMQDGKQHISAYHIRISPRS